jgi:iduronate 2-sulfatase
MRRSMLRDLSTVNGTSPLRPPCQGGVGGVLRWTPDVSLNQPHGRVIERENRGRWQRSTPPNPPLAGGAKECSPLTGGVKNFSVLALLILVLAPALHAADAKLNVLFLMADDMRPELGCYGHPQVQSPNIDALAKAGVRFDRAYCQYPLCNPSRSSLLTGRYPTTTDVLNNQLWVGGLHPEFVTLPRHFKNHGYVALRCGKIFHGGIDDAEAWDEGGEPRNFDGATAPDRKNVKDRISQSDRIVVLPGDGASHGDNKTADRAIDYLGRYQDKPFFLACGFTKPHSPPTAPQRFFDLYEPSKIPLPASFQARAAAPAGYPPSSITPNGDLFIQRDATPEEAKQVIEAYWASISYTDWNLGRVIAELDRLKLREKTVILFWGDHGYHLGEFGKWSKHGSLYEVGTRVPLMIALPGAKGNGQTVVKPVETVDLYPTLCELCGLQPPPGLQGHSLAPLLQNPQGEWTHPAFSVAGNRKNLGVAVRTDKYRYAEWNGGENGAMLFDEISDPMESKNLADDPKFAAVKAELSKLARDLPGVKP